MCAARLSFRWLLILLFLFCSHGAFAQVTISESDFQRLKSSLQLVKIDLKTWGESLNAREQELKMRESSLNQRESDLTAREADLLESDHLIAGLSNSLTIACESLNKADIEAMKIQAQNKLLKIGGTAGWIAAIVAACFIIF